MWRLLKGMSPFYTKDDSKLTSKRRLKKGLYGQNKFSWATLSITNSNLHFLGERVKSQLQEGREWNRTEINGIEPGAARTPSPSGWRCQLPLNGNLLSHSDLLNVVICNATLRLCWILRQSFPFANSSTLDLFCYIN